MLVWFRDGHAGPKELAVCAAGHSWPRDSFVPNRLRRPGRLSWWSAIDHNRTVIPTPASYTIAFALGLAMGAIVGVVTDVRWWWLGGPIGVAGAFVATASTAFRGTSRRRTLEHLHDVRDPDGAPARRAARRDTMIANRRFPIHAVADPPYPPVLGGTSSDESSGLLSITVVHREPTADGPAGIEVETRVLRGPMPDEAAWRDADEGHTFARWVAYARPGPHEQLSAMPPRSDDEEIDWHPMEVTVDGEPHGAKTLSIDAATLITVTLDNLHLTVRSLEPLDALKLTVIDPPPTPDFSR